MSEWVRDAWAWGRTVLYGPMWLAWLAGAAFAAVWQFLGGVFVCWCFRVICAVSKVAAGHMVNVLLPALEALPEPAEPFSVGPVVQVYLTIDHYAPITEGLAMMGLLLTFVVAFRVGRLVKSLIPTWSN